MDQGTIVESTYLSSHFAEEMQIISMRYRLLKGQSLSSQPLR